MKFFPVHCVKCGKTVYRTKRRINETKKFNWKTYCSLKCQSLAKNKQKILKCGNPSCSKTFKRQLKEIPPSKICFCSRSCAAIVNNPKSPKRIPKIRVCPTCGKEFTGDRKYCSLKCAPRETVTKEKIIGTIQDFYKNYGRIPLKREFIHVKAARNRFGSWNNAILAAGLNPNPVMFAKKHLANDGHKCDSLAEKIIDDWLYARKISHERNVPYHQNNMTADFKVNRTFIEFLGLHGELRKYDKLVKTKRKLWKDKGLKVIQIYPKDLFPKNKLDKILQNFKFS